MADSPYERKILEKLRVLHAEEEMLYEILKEVKQSTGKEKKDGKINSSNG